uniref:Uncharacterized protein n=1 Tax=Haptolina ericina TaxID=156174 RepID=A0A6T9IS29_9EUKA
MCCIVDVKRREQRIVVRRCPRVCSTLAASPPCHTVNRRCEQAVSLPYHAGPGARHTDHSCAMLTAPVPRAVLPAQLDHSSLPFLCINALQEHERRLHMLESPAAKNGRGAAALDGQWHRPRSRSTARLWAAARKVLNRAAPRYPMADHSRLPVR